MFDVDPDPELDNRRIFELSDVYQYFDKSQLQGQGQPLNFHSLDFHLETPLL